jgi:hypothetical protein
MKSINCEAVHTPDNETAGYNILTPNSNITAGVALSVQWLGYGNVFFSPPRPDRPWDPPSLLPNGFRGLLPGEVNRPGCEADRSLPSSAEVKNAWGYTSIPPYVFMLWCVVKQLEMSRFYFFLSVGVFQNFNVTSHTHTHTEVMNVLYMAISQKLFCAPSELSERCERFFCSKYNLHEKLVF